MLNFEDEVKKLYDARITEEGIDLAQTELAHLVVCYLTVNPKHAAELYSEISIDNAAQLLAALLRASVDAHFNLLVLKLNQAVVPTICEAFLKEHLSRAGFTVGEQTTAKKAAIDKNKITFH